MKHFSILLLAALPFVSVAKDVNPENINISNVTVTTTDDNRLLVSMKFDYPRLDLSSNQELRVVPYIEGTTGQRQDLDQFVIAGRARYYSHLRNDAQPVSVPVIRDSRAGSYEFNASTRLQPWMSLSELKIAYFVDGCCGKREGELPLRDLATIDLVPDVYVPEFVYMAPMSEGVKIREEEGSAYIDFVVNKTVINADYRNNPQELAAIGETIDRIRNDRDVTMTGMSIKGFASPEGSYDNNERLAKGRTQALKEYVQKLYQFPSDFIITSYEAEDWEGLRRYVTTHDIIDGEGILAIIDSNLSPDAKDIKIRNDYPDAYAVLLREVYPALRHSDYKVTYSVRSYTDVAEILRVMKEAPQKLDLSEFYLAAQSLKPGSPEFNEVFDIAVRMYPNDPVANLNAANAAMGKNDFESAVRYINRAGDSDEAVYAAGVLEALQGNYDAAIAIFEKVDNIDGAKEAIRQINNVRKKNGGNIIVH